LPLPAVAKAGRDGPVATLGRLGATEKGVSRLVERLSALPTGVCEIGWKTQSRLCRRYRALAAGGKRPTVAITAVVRELAGFVWAINGAACADS